ncbi:hypothetical protein Tco_0461962 [Tanacetum coccineum]
MLPLPLNSGAMAFLVANFILLTWHHFWSLAPRVYSEIVAEVWDELQETYDKIDGYVIHKIHGLKQDTIFSGSSSEAHPADFVAKSNNLSNNDVIRGNTRTNKGPNSNLLCKNYGLIDHTIERCYEIIGYPTGFKRNPKLVKQADNFNSRSFNGNVEAQRGASTSTRSTTFENAFTKEQMMKILSLINEKPIGNTNANMAGRYGVSAPELHKEPQRFKDLYAVSRRHHTSYSRIKTKNILEDIKRGLHSKKTLIRQYRCVRRLTAKTLGDFDWKSATYGKVKYFDDVNYFKDFEAEFPAIVFRDALISEPETPSKPTLSSPKGKKIDLNFEISFDESDDEDYTFMYDKN